MTIAMTIRDFIKYTGLTKDFTNYGYNIPTSIQELETVLDEIGRCFWSYSTIDADEVKDWRITVLVYDENGEQRYFETEETAYCWRIQ